MAKQPGQTSGKNLTCSYLERLMELLHVGVKEKQVSIFHEWLPIVGNKEMTD